MEDNYLWDRSGEPDPEVQELEEILGPLRYQPRPLEIPDQISVGRRRSFFPAMAIAAVIALCTVLLGFWFSLNRRQAAPPFQAARDSQTNQNATAPLPQVTPDKPAQQAASVVGVKSPPIQTRHASTRNLLARNNSRGTQTRVRQRALTPEELAEKEQVLIALRLVSAKLNLAQRKAQGAPQLNMIRNQHKIG